MALQADVPLFRSNVALVRVDVDVREGGRRVAGLSKDDFVVRTADGVRSVEHAADEKQPLELLVLLDISGSMEAHIRNLGRYAREAVSQLAEGDRAGIMAFHAWPEWVLKPTSDLGRVQAKLEDYSRKMRAGGMTYTADALRAATRHIRKHGRDGWRRALLVVTDNAGDGFLFTEREIVSDLLKADVSVNALLIGRNTGPVDLRRIAFLAGGYIGEVEQAGPAFAAMVEQIKRSYAVYFRPEPGDGGKQRTAVVELTPAARARHGAAVVNGQRTYVVD
jgi:Mg-chelatase subunit ChlD